MRSPPSDTDGAAWTLDTDATSAPARSSRRVGTIGRDVRIKGVVRGKEDLVVEGEVEGSIALPEHHLVLEGPSRTSAQVTARMTTMRGRHRGNAQATERLEVSSTACIIGDLRTPRLVIREGAKFRGQIDMEIDLPADLQPSPSSKSDGSTNTKKKGRREENDHG